MKALKAILIGAGNRGITYTDQMAHMPEKYEVIAVAEPVESRREYIKNKHSISDEMCFSDWKDLLALGKIADFAIIATMDRMHFEPCMNAIAAGYDILLEKPVCPSPQECMKIADAAEKKGVKIVVCHVLRYTPLFMTIKDLIDNGRIGKVMSINHEECVGNIHQSHSFVRGNWGNSGRSSCMLLQKSCHDMDILQWLIGTGLKKVQSFGMLSYFKEENAPKDAPEFCIEGCPQGDKCPYNAVNLYLNNEGKHWRDWFRSACTHMADPTDSDVKKAISTTQYGKCVFKCDNDVVDHQTVNLLFEGDVTVTFTMNAFNKGGRFIHIMGTKGEIRAALDGETPITLYDFEQDETTEVPMMSADGITGGHGGGDEGIVMALYDYLTDNYTGQSISDIRTSCNNHLIAFAAEKARETGTVVDFDEYLKTVR